MASAALNREEAFGLAISLAAHLALIAFLLHKVPEKQVVKPPERIEVTLSNEVAMQSTSPDPTRDAAPDVAPQIGEAAPAPETVSDPVAEALSRPVPPVVEQPAPAPVPKPVPRPVARPVPKPVEKPRPEPKPAAEKPRPAPPKPAQPKPAPPKPAERSESRRPAAKPAAKPASRPQDTAKPAAREGGSRIGSDFLEGASGAQGKTASDSPRAATIGPAVRSSLAGAISRQLKPHWSAPQGVDVDQLVTTVAWSLNKNGSLAGSPRVVRQRGINDANRAQAERHAEQAIRAIQLAAPFNLPEQYYDGWKRVQFDFDRSLSQ